MNATCLIVYASMTGNTEELASFIGDGIQAAGATVAIKDILEVDVLDLQEYDGIILGAYTWGDGDLPDEYLDFYDEMGRLNLTGKTAAAFGSCDSSYEHRGGAVDILTEKLAELGAEVVLAGLKIDLAPTEAEIEQCISFGQTFVEKSFLTERGIL
ncbi:flavodoxin [Neobacillus novalis]|uniref:Flavodoxin n=1 Tax=Neobacillus novalis TaxID=220687 RepID=A0AA95SF82_9BACI|nr:flavodoxin [Neobacillus novalis]WHY88963.1 flavodoxin [Neobacillus novalis]